VIANIKMSNIDINNNDTLINEFNKIIADNTLFRFKNELERCYDEEKKTTIKKIIKKLSNNSKDDYDSKEINKNKLNDFLDKMTHNKFKQTWSRLNPDQKLTKIEEFVNDVEKDKNKKKKLLIKLKKMLDNNKLATSKEVSYDKEECKINSIKNFEDIRENI
jgi:hypothetical protein